MWIYNDKGIIVKWLSSFWCIIDFENVYEK